ncbi:pimeloyl-ACP methyl ester carboxylesterase [Actinoalloteichus hoggarensis]|uniref:Alpha/beta hydrolase family protein n=1 Tax=Actinoalloteichus hoggarensis TaxID=1470176 RepID=A0A221W669_9PSEU|nr:alpha/beta fold hydrolase [Actinoalloteichus hoggarensis]ASO21442.1 Alpha/beta hydrolase family protein [Actinoalloteichus hoggarensis]MBB5922031.1 pimeloyl-ACP methyl ester carboxylesterase [Actinoalloteichus hoggarensis]
MTTAPQAGRPEPTFVLVSGTCGSAAGFVPLQRELALRGRRSLALDMPGHGTGRPVAYLHGRRDAAALAVEPSPMAGVTFQQTVEHVITNVRRVREYGPVILLGFSMGGAIIGGVGNDAPEIIDRVVYLSAWCPVSTSSMAECGLLPEQADSLLEATPLPVVGDAAELGAFRVDWRGVDEMTFAALKAALAADATDDEFRAMLDTMDSDETRAIATADSRVRAETWGRIPRSYLRLTEDRSIPVAMQDRMIAEADALTPDNRFDVHTLHTTHAAFWHRAAEVAAVLDSLA